MAESGREAEERRSMMELANGFEASVKAIVLSLRMRPPTCRGRRAGWRRPLLRANPDPRGAVGRRSTSRQMSGRWRGARSYRCRAGDRASGRTASEVTSAAVEESKRTNAQVDELCPRRQQIDEVVNLITASPGRPICWR